MHLSHVPLDGTSPFELDHKERRECLDLCVLDGLRLALESSTVVVFNHHIRRVLCQACAERNLDGQARL